jgi:hypothetical protein
MRNSSNLHHPALHLRQCWLHMQGRTRLRATCSATKSRVYRRIDGTLSLSLA